MSLPVLQETGPRGTGTGVRPWPGLCGVGTLVSPWGWDICLCSICGALYECLSPAVANMPALPMSMCPTWGCG